MLEIAKVVDPVLVMITVCDALHVSMSIEPKTRFVGVEPGNRLVDDRVTDCVAGTPVPESAMLSGESGALSVMVTAAIAAPVADGPKCP